MHAHTLTHTCTHICIHARNHTHTQGIVWSLTGTTSHKHVNFESCSCLLSRWPERSLKSLNECVTEKKNREKNYLRLSTCRHKLMTSVDFNTRDQSSFVCLCACLWLSTRLFVCVRVYKWVVRMFVCVCVTCVSGNSEREREKNVFTGRGKDF